MDRKEANKILTAKIKKHGRYGKRAPIENRTFEGRVFDSKAEMLWFVDLRIKERLGEICNLKSQYPEYPVYINDQLYCTYTPDASWCLYGSDDRRIIADYKSKGTKNDVASRLRRKAAELYYGIKIEVIVGE